MNIPGVKPVKGGKTVAGPVKPTPGREISQSAPLPHPRPVAYNRASLIGHHRMGASRGRPHNFIRDAR